MEGEEDSATSGAERFVFMVCCSLRLTFLTGATKARKPVNRTTIAVHTASLTGPKARELSVEKGFVYPRQSSLKRCQGFGATRVIRRAHRCEDEDIA